MKQIVPNLIIAGVNKAGTTSLFTYLSYHPNICASNIKETCFFLPYRYGENPETIEKYYQYFDHHLTEKVIMESTPGYFYGGKGLAEEIKQTCPETRIYILLREPVSRLISFYTKKKSRMDLPKEMSLRNYVDKCKSMTPKDRGKRENNLYFGLDGGFYSDYIQDWYEVFGDQLSVLFLDDLISSPREVLKQIAHDFKIDESFFETVNLDIENQSVGYKLGFLHLLAIKFNHSFEKIWRLNPGLKKRIRTIYMVLNGKKVNRIDDKEVKQELKNIYQPYNFKLRMILEKQGVKKFPAWLIQ